jgi:hypothetical protein
MCPFCIGATAWAVAGVVSAGGLGALAAMVTRRGTDAPSPDDSSSGGAASAAKREPAA